MSEDSKAIMLDKECFRCLVRGGVVLSGKIRIVLSDIGYRAMYDAITESQTGIAELYKDHVKD